MGTTDKKQWQNIAREHGRNDIGRENDTQIELLAGLKEVNYDETQNWCFASG